MADRAEAASRDDADELRAFHDRFVVADDGLIYLDGNSLGRLPRATRRPRGRGHRGEWGERLIRAWGEGWMELPLTLGDRIGSELLGAAPGQVAVADSTTVCFYKLAAAALTRGPGARRSSPTSTTSPPTATCSRAWPPSAGSRSCGSRPTRRAAPSPSRWPGSSPSRPRS